MTPKLTGLAIFCTLYALLSLWEWREQAQRERDSLAALLMHAGGWWG